MRRGRNTQRKALTTATQTLLVCIIAGGIWFAISGEAGVDQIALYLFFGLFAVGMDLLWGRAGVMSFGHAVWFGLGAYVYAWIGKGTIHGDASFALNAWLPAATLLGVLAAVLVPALGAGLFGWVVFPSGIRGPYFAVITMALSFLMASLALAAPTIFGGWTGIGFVPPLSIGGFVIVGDYHPWRTFIVAASLCVLTTYALRRVSLSRIGLKADGIRDNEVRLEYIGVNIPNVKLILYMVSAAVSGAAGALYAAQSGYVSPELIGVALSTEVAIWVAVGGRGSLSGAVLGALLVRGIGNLLGSAAIDYWQIILGVLFVLVVLFARSGTMGLLEAVWDRYIDKRRKPPVARVVGTGGARDAS